MPMDVELDEIKIVGFNDIATEENGKRRELVKLNARIEGCNSNKMKQFATKWN